MLPLIEGTVVVLMVVTAYCACPLCTAPYNNAITASGAEVMEGRTVAAGPSVPFNTQVYIQGVGTRTVEDRGGAIGDRNIDVYFASHEAALRFGRRHLWVWRDLR